MFCTNCGEETEPKNGRCTRCGFNLSAVIALLNKPDDEMDDVEDEIRSAEEIARRALTLAAVISCAYGDPRAAVSDWLKQENLWQETTPLERAFLEKDVDEKTRREFTWKIEALIPLLWAINKIDEMPDIKTQCDTEPLKQAVIWPPNPTKDYIGSSTLRDEEVIYKEYEKVYQAHWKVRDARLNKKKIPKKFDPEVVYERHYGFNWVIGYMGQNWDDITTDT
jgi:hypothetical protein